MRIFLSLLFLCVLLPRSHAAVAPVVINEIMYHPPGDLEKLQFVEIFNRGGGEVDLSGWSFSKGVRFTFAPGVRLAAGAYLAVCRSTNDVTRHYGAETPVAGNFAGKLGNSGDTLELSDARGQVVDSVTYSDRGAWAAGADGHSASLERISTIAPSGLPENWAASKLPRLKSPAGSPGGLNSVQSTNLPPVISSVDLQTGRDAASQGLAVSARVEDSDGVRAVRLVYRVIAPGSEGAERETPMERLSGDLRSGVYRAITETVPEGRLVRYRIKAVDETGAARTFPAENEPRPTLSYSTFGNANRARIPSVHVLRITPPESGQPADRRRARAPRFRFGAPPPAEESRGNGALVYSPPGGGPVQIFDHVGIRPRKGGFKVHFHKDQPLDGMTTINVINEGAPRWLLSEALSYELYRMAGVMTPKAGHLRIHSDGQHQGFHLMVEQPNKAFLRRNGRDESGSLYKLLWYGQDVIGKHEKKNNPESGHEDLLRLLSGLDRSRGGAQWGYIQKQFHVDNMASYFAVNMCIQNWDGFFNNYFVYHDPKSDRWEMIPWDEDKTWGDFDGAPARYDWYEMPLTMGMNGDRAPSGLIGRGWQGPWGGPGWWRPAGYFSGPLLANAEFRKRFLGRVDELCRTVFTEEKFLPIINDLEQRLLPEVRAQAQGSGQDPRSAVQAFQADIQSFRNQLTQRRRFLVDALKKTR